MSTKEEEAEAEAVFLARQFRAEWAVYDSDGNRLLWHSRAARIVTEDGLLVVYDAADEPVQVYAPGVWSQVKKLV